MQLSVVICTHNEERNLWRTLTAVHDVADEIIIVDSLSTDKTREIAKQFTKVKLFTTTWKGYAQTKNEANALAQGEYIFSLDADEEISPELKNELLALKPRLQGCYTINRLTNYCGQWINHSGWFPDRVLRIFPRTGSKWQGDFVHETLKVPEGLTRADLKGLVHHHSYHSLDDHLARVNRYSTLGAQELLAKGHRGFVVRAFFRGVARFLKTYIVKRGFLDGRSGLVIAVLTGFGVFLKYAKTWQMSRRSTGE